MTTNKPALQYNQAKRLMPTTASSAELAELPAQIRERARFSARTADLSYLAEMDKLLSDYITPSAAGPEAVTDFAGVRLALKQELAARGYTPAPGTGGSLMDLSSDSRLNLIIETNTQMAYGYGQYAAQQDPVLLDAFPCLELYRIEQRIEKRDWRARWLAAGGHLYNNRMIARKDSPIWSSISRFNTPYPPFDFNSGMWTRNISRKTATNLGIITRADVIQPTSRTFNQDLSATLPDTLSPALKAAVQRAFKTIAITLQE